jgi:hypothetical protein
VDVGLMLFQALILVGVLLVMVLGSWHFVRQEIVLDNLHRQATAVVVEVDQGKGPGTALVRYPLGRRSVLARMDLTFFGASPNVHDRVLIQYSPSDPEVIRMDGEHPLIGWTVVVAALLLFFGWLTLKT